LLRDGVPHQQVTVLRCAHLHHPIARVCV
jgi:hypothetical protein